MKCLGAAVLACVALGMPATGFAAQSDICWGNVKHIRVQSNGVLRTWLHRGNTSGYFDICSVAGTYQGVAAATCNAWLQLLQAGQLSGRQVRFMYSNPVECTSGPNTAPQEVSLDPDGHSS